MDEPQKNMYEMEKRSLSEKEETAGGDRAVVVGGGSLDGRRPPPAARRSHDTRPRSLPFSLCRPTVIRIIPVEGVPKQREGERGS